MADLRASGVKASSRAEVPSGAAGTISSGSGECRLEARVSILMYHQVGRFKAMRQHRANYCDAGRFARQMALLAQGGFNVIALEQALAGLQGQQPLPPRAVLLTFDDAYAGFVEHALPVLVAHAFPAVVYAISGWVGQRMRWATATPGRAEPALMSAAQLRGLKDSGVCIGSHGANHRKLGELALAEQARELGQSRAALEDLLGQAVPHLCYPFGSFTRATVQLAAEAGYQSAMTCLRGAATGSDHPLVLPRKAISFGDNLMGFGWKLFKHRPKPALEDWRRWSRERSILQAGVGP
ncbi:polysaccharide deacetylase family protein [Lamprobacter modestohalophilus]|uniref:polysaccharide deacetylase family protein n=1 Tax=Lamprobacter modestohalophilus TaxID=1064514 RepID=UPI002ADEF08A|nr:polysaccharide deacetylase family protein [Lamprobacter modestohalophilus]MEA1048869.1 polysaccharide deacetylase family protein [Lamprobacter modestohalophilus]